MEDFNDLILKSQDVKKQIEKINDEWFIQIKNFLGNTTIKKMEGEYFQYIKEQKKEEDKFNLFNIISDKYPEIFHSKIIAALLNPNEQHGEGNRFLVEFLKYLRDKHKVDINIKDYTANTEVSTEECYIDIWIKNNASRKCIIIENKINDATDQYGQLCNYYKKALEQQYTVDAVVYITKNGREPHDVTYKACSIKEIEKIKELLINVAIYNSEMENNKDLYHGWLQPCLSITNNINTFFLILQYLKHLKQLKSITMNAQLMEKFYEYIKDEKNFEDVKNVRNALNDLMNDLPKYLVQKVKEEYELKVSELTAFNTVKMTDRCVFEKFQNKEYESTILEVRVIDNGEIRIDFYDDSYEKREEPTRVEKMLKSIGYYNMFLLVSDKNRTGEGKWYVSNKKFKVTQNLGEYQEMRRFLADFHKKLREVFVNTQE